MRNFIAWWKYCRKTGHRWVWWAETLGGWWVHCVRCGLYEEHLPGLHDVLTREEEQEMLDHLDWLRATL
jgi:hypothetical protein